MKRKLLVAALAIGVAFLTGVPVADATPTAPGTAGFVAPAGVVRLEFVHNRPQVALYATPSSTTPSDLVAISTDSKCQITNLSDIGRLLDISVVGMKKAGVYLYDNGIGALTSG